MSSCRSARLAFAGLAFAGLAFAGLAVATAAGAQSVGMNGIGRPATPQEIAAWDIDVRPDFKGLPKGSGTVAQGMVLWEALCASCHGVFGESNAVFSPLVGGSSAGDIEAGRVARLTDTAYPGRSTLMKLATLSTLWDYIARAMPWNAPKSLTPDQVYALSAFMLNLGGVVADDFTLNDRNIAQVQQRLPNRHGMSTEHGLWPGKTLGNRGQLDVKAVACMSGCASETTVFSSLPEHARNAHGNLALQNRLVGAQRGADTTRAPDARTASASAAAAAVVATVATVATAATTTATPVEAAAAATDATTHGAASAPTLALARKLNCLSCHGIDHRLVGPGMREVSKQYADRSDAADYLAQRIVTGGSGVWGSVPMPPQSLSPVDAKALAQWIVGGARP